MKKYKLDVENWGDEKYMLVSRGHHNIEEFKGKCREDYEAFMSALDHEKSPCACEHLWFKAVPKTGYIAFYTPSRKGVRGAFPATVWWQ